jgi:hypothetical protein
VRPARRATRGQGAAERTGGVSGGEAQMAEIPLRMSPAEAAKLTELLASATHLLEWGSGGSTLAAVRSKVRTIMSIETDPAWIARLKAHDEIAAAIAAHRLIFRHVDVGPVGDWGVPTGQEKICNWPRYALEPFTALDIGFDLIFIDGRFRVHCLLAIVCCADQNTVTFLHDYRYRHAYTIADKYFDIIDRVDSSAVLKLRSTINYRALYIDLIRSIFDP